MVELEEYEGDNEDDYGLDIYDELVEKGKAYDICRQKIGKGYIYGVFNDKSAIGYLASVKGTYVGFIIYTKHKGYIYLDLVCTIKSELVKGVPLGQILIAKMEQEVLDNGFKLIKADAVTPALPFYKSTGWKVTGKPKGNKHPIEKSLGIVKKLSPKPKKQVKKVAKKPAKKPVKKAKKKKSGFFGSLKKLFKM